MVLSHRDFEGCQHRLGNVGGGRRGDGILRGFVVRCRRGDGTFGLRWFGFIAVDSACADKSVVLIAKQSAVLGVEEHGVVSEGYRRIVLA